MHTCNTLHYQDAEHFPIIPVSSPVLLPSWSLLTPNPMDLLLSLDCFTVPHNCSHLACTLVSSFTQGVFKFHLCVCDSVSHSF